MSHRPKSNDASRNNDKVSHLNAFSTSLYNSLDGKYLRSSIELLGGELSAHLLREVPEENYSTAPEWVQAVKREIDEVLLPRARAEMESPVYLAAKAEEFITTDRILEDLVLEERLDAMVDRATADMTAAEAAMFIEGLMDQLSARHRKFDQAAAVAMMNDWRKTSITHRINPGTTVV